eukprot:CAMPEP_0196129922 /NCGR_PEP_ID=MMETSP0910-20130528/472_1 /TAXON_ID=49265 /ORGANISM="Thalassiosira rotula, Strain GSO102" /LENGTH=57 /DNA_ID=CAMNT_0041389125 /DNA_START=115 /DNA_END=284 /DNA_ORIENTATION=+
MSDLVSLRGQQTMLVKCLAAVLVSRKELLRKMVNSLDVVSRQDNGRNQRLDIPSMVS